MSSDHLSFCTQICLDSDSKSGDIATLPELPKLALQPSFFPLRKYVGSEEEMCLETFDQILNISSKIQIQIF